MGNELIKTEKEDIKNLIYTIRGKQVMLDSDVAMLYECETKYINRVVKRNLKRFPEDFCFQLTEEEFKSLRCQFVTLNKSKRGQHRKYMPYVFTEQGISMLSPLLNSEISVQSSINIMRAFVEIRNKNVEVVILTSEKSNISKLDVQKFNKEYPVLKVAKTDKFHDRFIIIDNKELYHCGASIKDLGKKCFAISKMGEDTLDQYGLLTLLAIKLNLPEKDTMYNYTISHETDIEISNFLKIFYAENSILKNTEKASVDYSINGTKNQVNLDNGKVVSINIKSGDNFVINQVNGNVTASLEQVKAVTKPANNKNIITKTYFVNNVGTNNFNVGDIVTVKIELYCKDIEKGVYTVEDVLPNGMSYLYEDTYNSDKSAVTNPMNISGQKLTFIVYYDGTTNPYIMYKASISGVGNYMSDGTILKDNNNNIISYNAGSSISVSH
ncbi:MAG: ORF6N domain-containing protein [Oscillospiraceae bacterium]|nr:ORF6N domain-containing protein [Oscillospiraceae bacterium]